MAGDYDHIFRENFGRIFLPFIERTYGFQIASTADLPEKLQKTLKRELDFVKRVTTEAGQEFILHIEFQATNHPKMVYRMNVYHALLLEKFQLPIFQVVLYMGAKEAKMRSQLEKEEVTTGFHLVDLPSINFHEFLKSEIPEEIILAILADHRGHNPTAVVRLIISRLLQVEQDEVELEKMVEQLRTLSRIRKLEYIFEEELPNMPLTIDIKKDRLYQKGMEQGMEQGIEKGTIAIVLEMLRSGKFSIEDISAVAKMSIAEIEELKDEHQL